MREGEKWSLRRGILTKCSLRDEPYLFIISLLARCQGVAKVYKVLYM